MLNNGSRTSLMLKFVLLLIFFGLLAATGWYAKKNSYYDFDILFYTACVLRDGNRPADKIHQESYSLLKAQIGEDRFRMYVDSTNKYRYQMYLYPDKFMAQLPFYQLKPLYILILKAGNRAGFSPVYFSTLINLSCYFVIAVVIVLYLVKRLSFFPGIFSALCITFSPMVLDTVRNNTPDLLAALLLLSSTLLFLSSRKHFQYISVLLFVLLVLVRVESILLVTSVFVFGMLSRQERYSRNFLWLLILSSALPVIMITVFTPGHQWGLLYKHTFLGYLPDLNKAGGLTLPEYLKGFRAIPRSLFVSDFFLILFFLIIPFLIARILDVPRAIIQKAFLLFIAFRLFLFPDLSIRFYTGLYIVAFLFFAEFLLLWIPVHPVSEQK